jgi:hypothetical protein
MFFPTPYTATATASQSVFFILYTKMERDQSPGLNILHTKVKTQGKYILYVLQFKYPITNCSTRRNNGYYCASFGAREDRFNDVQILLKIAHLIGKFYF